MRRPAPAPAYSVIPLGDSLAVELPALTRAALVRIQVPQPTLRAASMSALSVEYDFTMGCLGDQFIVLARRPPV